MRDSEEQFRQIVENIREVFWVSTMDFQEVLYVSPAYEQAWGRTCESLYKHPLDWMEGIHSEDRERTKARLAEAFQRKERFSVEYRVVLPDGSMCYIHDRGFPVLYGTGHPYRLVGIATDITERKRTEEELERLAVTDGTTGLYNAQYFKQRVQQEIARARRRGPAPCLVMIDLDNFKTINDNYGHQMGDDALVAVSKVFRGMVRASDTAARYGGDEFCILLTGTSLKAAQKVMEEIHKRLGALTLTNADGRGVRITCSMGLVALAEECQDAKSFINNADEALYKAKAAGDQTDFLYQP